MKILILLLLALFSISCAVPVFDKDGHEVKVGVRYIAVMVPSIPARRGGTITLEENPNSFPCPLFVIVRPRILQNGVAEEIPSMLPLTFHPANSSDTVVHTLTNLNIRTEYNSMCRRFWVVRSNDYITSGNLRVLPPLPPIPNFKIEPSGKSFGSHAYTFSYEDSDVDLDLQNNRLFVNKMHLIGPITPRFVFVKDNSGNYQVE